MNYKKVIPEDLFAQTELIDGNVTITYESFMLLRRRISYLEGMVDARLQGAVGPNAAADAAFARERDIHRSK